MPFELPDLRPIRGWEGFYAVTACGRVRSLARTVTTIDGRSWKQRARWMKPVNYGHGYHGVTLHREGGERRVMVHRLVAEAWLPPRAPHQTQVNHKDSNRRNNDVRNLEWCTHSENAVHGWREGKSRVTPAMREAFARGQAARRGLTREQVHDIRARVARGETQTSVARAHGSNNSTVCWIVSGKLYASF